MTTTLVLLDFSRNSCLTHLYTQTAWMLFSWHVNFLQFMSGHMHCVFWNSVAGK